ncbi:hypothetical protein GCM10009851_26010 [Herbiconiux moechotypicola]|uniref:Response regulator transcription factor n=1 Tax=Herbiconiux moechotypicola TaxID=637393 RepID=A0ABN3DQT3_9MICO
MGGGGAAAPSLALLEGQALVLDSLSAWLGEHAPDLNVALRCSTWNELSRSPAFPFDVVVMQAGEGERISMESRIRACRDRGASVVVLGDLDSDELERRALDAGAGAYTSKQRPARELLVAVRRVLRSRAAGSLTAWDGPGRRHSGSLEPRIRFTEEEEEILRLYASGHSPIEVSMILGTNIQAVKNSLDRVREKYTAEGRPADRKQDLMLRAAEDGYLA